MLCSWSVLGIDSSPPRPPGHTLQSSEVAGHEALMTWQMSLVQLAHLQDLQPNLWTRWWWCPCYGPEVSQRLQDSDSSWLLQNYHASQRISRASSILQEAKQLSTTTFSQAKSNESMGPSPLRATGIRLLLRALCTLCDDVDMSEDLQLTLAKFVCTAYRPKGIQLSSIPELCWHLFCKCMAESEKLPPTLGALKQHILRAHVQARVWGQAVIPQQELLDPPGEWLPRGQRWRTAPANHYWCPTSTWGRRGDGQVQGKLLIESLFIQVQELAMHGP